MKLWRRRCRFYEGNGQFKPAFLPSRSLLEKDWENAKNIYELPGSLKDIRPTSMRSVIFPVVIFA